MHHIPYIVIVYIASSRHINSSKYSLRAQFYIAAYFSEKNYTNVRWFLDLPRVGRATAGGHIIATDVIGA